MSDWTFVATILGVVFAICITVMVCDYNDARTPHPVQVCIKGHDALIDGGYSGIKHVCDQYEERIIGGK